MPIDRETGEGMDKRDIIAEKFHVYGDGTMVDPCKFVYRMLHEQVKDDGKWVDGKPTPYHLAVDLVFPDGTHENRIADIWFGGGDNHYNEPRISATKRGLSEEIIEAILSDIGFDGFPEENFGRSPSSPEGDDDGEHMIKEAKE